MAELNDKVILSIQVSYDKAFSDIAAYEQRIIDLKAANEKLDKSNAAQAKQYEINRAAIKECEYSMRVLRKEVQNNIRAEESNESSLKKLRAQLSLMTKQYDELSKAQREGAFGKALQADINKVTKELKDAEAGTERFYRNVGNYENALKNALGLNNNFANSIMGLARGGDGVKGFFASATTAVQSFGKALMSLMANPVFLAIAGIAGAVGAFKWFFDYNQGIAEATRLTKEFLGVEGDALRGVRDSIQATADVMGKDYTDVLKTVDALMAQYHISAEDAIKVVNEGFAAGADLSGDMLAKLQQYAPTFHDAGLKADEMVAIIAQTRSGIFSDKGLDVITMASKRIREMSTATASALDNIGISSKQVESDLVSGAKTTFDVIQEVSARLKELPQNGQEVGEVLKDVFGRTAAEGGLQMIEQLDTMSTKMEDVLEVTGEYGQLQLEQIEAQNELNDAVSTLFDMSDQGWENMITRVKIFATKTLAALIRKIVDIINYFIDLYNESMTFRAVVQGIIVLFKGMWETAKLVFGNMLAAIKGVAKALAGVGDIFVGIITLDPSHVKSGLATLRDAFITGIKEIGQNSTQYGQAMVDNFMEGAQRAAKDHINPLSSAMGVDSGTGGGSDVAVTGGVGGGKGTSTGGGKGAAAKAAAQRAKEIDKQAKDEREQVRKLAELMNKLIDDNFEKQRETINLAYDRQIDDIRAKLAEEGKHTTAARRAMYAQIDALEQLRAIDLAKLDEQKTRKEIEQENKRIALMLQAIKKGSEQEEAMRLQQLDNEQAIERASIESSITNEQTRLEMLLALDEAYAKKRADLAREYRQKERDEMLLALQNDANEKMMHTTDEVERLRIQLEQLQAVRDMARQKEDESDEQWRARRLEMEKNYADKQKELAQKEIEVQEAKANAIGQLMGGIGSVMEQFADKNRSIAIASKVLAIAEVAVQQGIAIANAIRAASEGSHSVWEMIAQIGVGIASVTTSILSALKSIKSAKFARGGRVTGAGTGTSDSIPAMLSNGESVINARSTAMFAPLLSAINQLGGGVPFMGGRNVQVGEEWLSVAVARGMAAAPRPVVSVEEINRVQGRVEVLENYGSL